jgi:hypothetical protein
MYTPPVYEPTYPIGTVVTARPWVSGSELDPQRGLVCRLAPSGNDEYTVVWFPHLGAPESGPTVMVIRTEKIHDAAPLETGIDGMPFTELARLAAAGFYDPDVDPRWWPLAPELYERIDRLAGQ